MPTTPTKGEVKKWRGELAVLREARSLNIRWIKDLAEIHGRMKKGTTGTLSAERSRAMKHVGLAVGQLDLDVKLLGVVTDRTGEQITKWEASDGHESEEGEGDGGPRVEAVGGGGAGKRALAAGGGRAIGADADG